MLLLNILLQVTNPVNLPETSPEMGLSLFDLLLKGGFVMVPIFILSLATLYLFMERWLFIRSANKIKPAFLVNVENLMRYGHIDEAMRLCERTASPIARILNKGLSRIGSPVRDIEAALENTAQVEVYNLEKNLGYLSAIAAVAPMMGFLGTVTGMIKAFYHISLADNISIGIIAGGIYEKMITSAAGLLVGMLAYALHTYLVAQIDRTVNTLEVASISFMDILFKVPTHEFQEN
ncbi:MotA/TolQ/ExbB proton channel family protein [Adhaeribacter rhizoryzae]|uniref:MotA/TolQ/ExbB proton channel family protein n=1 Tax=Adhaeribacter rhizoryzae TaxID=2607907 RepID=A0A5M6D010_9BACT|nr:MotA/TolQ/ExbB proton channel family protein [Adhaeribacter rhizoryzae]KAA5540807.1 MotA/TolQ/ExbB proton channel family protein [Adhaeribacter rhizoryzae]